MSYSISGTTITLTRGDTFKCNVTVLNSDETPYQTEPGDKFRFAMKKTYDDSVPFLIKEIPTESMELTIEAKETKKFAFGSYVYDIQLRKEDGTVDTFIKGKLRLTEEVD